MEMGAHSCWSNCHSCHWRICIFGANKKVRILNKIVSVWTPITKYGLGSPWGLPIWVCRRGGREGLLGLKSKIKVLHFKRSNVHYFQYLKQMWCSYSLQDPRKGTDQTWRCEQWRTRYQKPATAITAKLYCHRRHCFFNWLWDSLANY